MENIIITSRYVGDKFDIMLAPSIQKIRTKCVNVSDKPDVDDEDLKTISNKYNVGIKTIIENSLLTNDTIVILAKSNVSIADPMAIDKLYYTFTENPEIGIVGVRGVSQITGSTRFYDPNNNPVNGIVYNVDDIEKGEYRGSDLKGFYTDIIAVDDSVIAIRGSALVGVDKFFEVHTNIGFGIEAVINILKRGYEAAVIDMFIISNEYTDIDSSVIDEITSKMNLTYPITVDSLNITKNFVVDVEL